MRVDLSSRLILSLLFVLFALAALQPSLAELRCRPITFKQDTTAPHTVEFYNYNCSVYSTNLLTEAIRFRITDPTATITSIIWHYNGTWGNMPDTETGELTAMEALLPWTAASGNLTYAITEIVPDGMPAAVSAGWFTFWDQAMNVVARVHLVTEFTEVGSDTARE